MIVNFLGFDLNDKLLKHCGQLKFDRASRLFCSERECFRFAERDQGQHLHQLLSLLVKPSAVALEFDAGLFFVPKKYQMRIKLILEVGKLSS